MRLGETLKAQRGGRSILDKAADCRTFEADAFFLAALSRSAHGSMETFEKSEPVETDDVFSGGSSKCS